MALAMSSPPRCGCERTHLAPGPVDESRFVPEARDVFEAEPGGGARRSPAGGASTSRLPGTSAAGCASHVGYQNDRTSRRA